jgi:hypothetical protein
MPHKLFYSWQSEQPPSVTRGFIRKALEKVSTTLNQSGIDERIEVDSDTKGVPGTPEIFSTILSKIEDAALFVADLTTCANSGSGSTKRLFPNSNVMFEYGYALKAKGRSRLICVMNTFYGGADPTELPFDLRHARGPIRFALSPDTKDHERSKIFDDLYNELLAAAKLILDNLPGEADPIIEINFQGPHFKAEEEITPEGDYPGQINPTLFTNSPGFIFLFGRPLETMDLSISQITKCAREFAGLQISDNAEGGSYSSNKWGRVTYALERGHTKRVSADYVQYFRSGAIEIVNGSYFRMVANDPMHVGFVVNKIALVLEIMKEWIEKTGTRNWLVEVGVIGVERRRLTTQNFGNRGPLIHRNKISVQRRVDKDSILLLAEEIRAALLAEIGM